MWACATTILIGSWLMGWWVLMPDLSLDDLRNLPEVTSRVEAELGRSIKEHVRNGVGVPTGQFDLRTLLAAARAFSRLVSVCTTCSGSLKVWDCQCGHAVENHNLDIDDAGLDFCSRCDCRRWRQKPCPDCTDGLVVSPEAVERFADAHWEYRRNNDVTDTPDHMRLFEAGLRAALGIGGEG